MVLVVGGGVYYWVYLVIVLVWVVDVNGVDVLL